MSEKEFISGSTSRKWAETISKTDLEKFLFVRFNHLPEGDRKMFTYGCFYLGLNGAFAGLIANSLMRRILHVTQARVTTSVVMAGLPFITTVAIYKSAVTQPLMKGDLNCSACALTRGGLVGLLTCWVYPILLAIPVNGRLAAMHQTSPMPSKGNIMRFCINVSKPVLNKMSYVLVLQVLFGSYISKKHFSIYEKMFDLPLTVPGTDIV